MSTRVLLVEDFLVHREIGTDALTDAGFDVTGAADEAEANAALDRVAADSAGWVIVLDIRILGDPLAGIRLLARIAGDERLRRVPVLIASALRKSEVLADLDEHGVPADGIPFLPKPFLNEELVAVVHRLAEGPRET